MIININELRHMENMSFKIGEAYTLSLNVSSDGQTLTITTSQTNVCEDQCSYGKTSNSIINNTDLEKKLEQYDFKTVLKQSEIKLKKRNKKNCLDNITEKARKTSDIAAKQILTILNNNPYLLKNTFHNGE